MSEVEESKTVESEEKISEALSPEEAPNEDVKDKGDQQHGGDDEKDTVEAVDVKNDEEDADGSDDKDASDKEDPGKEGEAKEETNDQNLKDLEKQEEAKLRARYPDMKTQGASSFLQKRLSKGTKYFDSGDYNMAKAKVGSTKPAIGPGQKIVLPGPTGDAIPTPATVPHKKISNLQSKLVNMS